TLYAAACVAARAAEAAPSPRALDRAFELGPCERGPAGAFVGSVAAQRRRGRECAPERPGALRLDQGPGREARVRPAEAPQRRGQAPGPPRPEGGLGGRGGPPGLFGGLPEAPGHPGHAACHRGGAVELPFEKAAPPRKGRTNHVEERRTALGWAAPAARGLF